MIKNNNNKIHKYIASMPPPDPSPPPKNYMKFEGKILHGWIARATQHMTSWMWKGPWISSGEKCPFSVANFPRTFFWTFSLSALHMLSVYTTPYTWLPFEFNDKWNYNRLQYLVDRGVFWNEWDIFYMHPSSVSASTFSPPSFAIECFHQFVGWGHERKIVCHLCDIPVYIRLHIMCTLVQLL